MQVSDNIKTFLDNSAKFNNSIILVTNLEKIIYNSIDENLNDNLDNNFKEFLFTMHNNDEVVKVYNKYKIKILKSNTSNIQNEVIMLILNNNQVVGSLILLNHNLNFEVSNFAFTSSVFSTLKTMLSI